MSLTSQPTPAQLAWRELEFGMFVHFGPNTFAGVGWGDGNFPATQFCPAKLDCRQWAQIAAEAGMKYAVLTAKHHDGFCLWPSKLTPYSVAHSPQKLDVVAEFVAACREFGLQPGLYYSLWDRNFPDYENDAIYAEFMRGQIAELLQNYGPIVQLWFDGGWDKEYPNRKWPYEARYESEVAPDVLRGARWEWRRLYEWIHELQPACLVANNSSSNRPGTPRYLPVDFRTAEHFDFVFREELCPLETREIWRDENGDARFLPLEFCATLTPSWFHTGRESFGHPSAQTIAGWRQTARENGANLLLNIGPNRDGLLPAYHREFLLQARDDLRVWSLD